MSLCDPRACSIFLPTPKTLKPSRVFVLGCGGAKLNTLLGNCLFLFPLFALLLGDREEYWGDAISGGLEIL